VSSSSPIRMSDARSASSANKSASIPRIDKPLMPAIVGGGPVGSGVAIDHDGRTMTTDWARPVVHWEIEAKDPQAQRAFYAALFNWDIEPGGIMNIAAGIGGPEPGPAGHIRQSGRSGVTLYVQVRDLDET